MCFFNEHIRSRAWKKTRASNIWHTFMFIKTQTRTQTHTHSLNTHSPALNTYQHIKHTCRCKYQQLWTNSLTSMLTQRHTNVQSSLMTANGESPLSFTYHWSMASFRTIDGTTPWPTLPPEGGNYYPWWMTPVCWPGRCFYTIVGVFVCQLALSVSWGSRPALRRQQYCPVSQLCYASFHPFCFPSHILQLSSRWSYNLMCFKVLCISMVPANREGLNG